MRRAPIVAILALLLSLAAAVVPPALPAVPVPAAFAPPAALAADDLEVGTAARYTVVPDRARVKVVVDVTARNDKPSAATGGGITRFYFDGVKLGVQPEARSVRATQDGAAARVAVAKATGYRVVTVSFTHRLYHGQTAHVRLTFDLPGGAPRSSSDVRVGAAFATFAAWAFGDRGTVRVEVPSGFQVDITGEDMTPAPGREGLQAWTATSSDPVGWYAFVDATNDAALTSDRLVLPGDEQVVIRGWPNDQRWRSRVRSLLRDGVPALVQRIGLAWPVRGPLTVTEVYTPLMEGYGGFYDPQTDRITISEDLDDLIIVHEASHAWFNRLLFTDRWITEGLADEYASRVLKVLGHGAPAPDPVSGREDAAFPLSDWPPPSAITDRRAQAREQYGYDASWTLMRRILKLVGEDRMRRVFQAASAGTTAYPVEDPPEKTTMPNDWRRFLDLVDGPQEGGAVDDLVASLALSDSEKLLLPPRAAARSAYRDLATAGGTWAPPLVVRRLLDGWDFTRATDAMHQADEVLGSRDRIGTLAAARGLTPDDGLEADYQDAGSTSELQLVEDGAARSLTVLQEVAAASDAAGAPRDWLADLGLDGLDPVTVAKAAGAAWEAGDLATAEKDAGDAAARLQAAPAAGRTKALAIGGLVSLLLLVLAGVLVLALVRRHGATARRARAAAVAVMPAATMPVPTVPAARRDPGDAATGWPPGVGLNLPSPPPPPSPTDRPASWPPAPPPAPVWQAPRPGPPGTLDSWTPVPPLGGLAGVPEGPGPYATLRPDGPPADPPVEPTSGDQGADRS